jgi:hypothetical protein
MCLGQNLLVMPLGAGQRSKIRGAGAVAAHRASLRFTVPNIPHLADISG